MSAIWWWLFSFRGTCVLYFFRSNLRHSSCTMDDCNLFTDLLGPCTNNRHQSTASTYWRSHSRRRLPRTSTSAFEKIITARADAGASLGPSGYAWAWWIFRVAANVPARFTHSKSFRRLTSFVLTYAGYLKTPGIWRPLYSRDNPILCWFQRKKTWSNTCCFWVWGCGGYIVEMCVGVWLSFKGIVGYDHIFLIYLQLVSWNMKWFVCFNCMLRHACVTAMKLPPTQASIS